MAQEWQWLARILDGADLRLDARRLALARWRRLPLRTRISAAAACLALLVTLAYLALRLFTGS